MAAGRPASRPPASNRPASSNRPTGSSLQQESRRQRPAWRGVFPRAFLPGRFAGVDNMGIVDNGFLIDALRCYCGHCGQVKNNSPHYPQKGKGKSRQQKGMGKRGQYGQYGQVLFKSYNSNPIYTNFNS